MVVGLRPADLVEVLQNVGGVFRLAVQRRHLVEDAVERAFHRGAVVADLPEDQRVVALADVLQRIENTADFVIGLRGVGGEGLHQPRGDILLVRRQRILRRDFLGPRRQLGVGRNDAQLELPLIRLLAVLVPALVELALELGDPDSGT